MQTGELSLALGFRYTEREIEGGRSAVLWGEIDECEVYLRFDLNDASPAPTFVYLNLAFTAGQDRLAIARRLDESSEAKSLRAAHGVDLVNDRPIDVSSGSVEWMLVIEKGILGIEASGLASLVRAYARTASADAPPLTRACQVCLSNGEVPREIEDDRVTRICASCRMEIRMLEAADAGKTDAPADSTGVAIDPERFRSRVAEFRKRHDDDPASYWRWLIVWVLLGQIGFLFLSAGLVIVAGLAVAAVVMAFKFSALLTLKFGAIFLKLGKVAILAFGGAAILIWKLIQSLVFWPAAPPPEYVLTRASAPRFLAWLDALADEMSAPRPDRVVLSRDLNASVSERESGYVGFERVLTIGLPVLECLDRDEFRAVIAHEFGHLIHEDVASLWVFRTSQRWFEALEWFERCDAGALVRRFVTWYAPEFLLRAQVVARRQEVRADARAAAVTSPALLISALTKISIAGQLLGAAWQRTLDHAVSGADFARPDDPVAPEGSPLLARCAAELVRFGPGPRRLAISNAMATEPDWQDSHPTLHERAVVLGVPLSASPAPALDPTERARDLVDDYSRHQATLDAQWTRDNGSLLGRGRLFRRRLRGLESWIVARLGDDARAPVVVLAARTKRHLGEFAEAKSLYDRAIALDPTHLDARRETLELHFESENWPAALEQVDGLCAHEKADADHHRFAASVCEAAGYDARAREIYENLLARDPEPAVRRFLEKKLGWLGVCNA